MKSLLIRCCSAVSGGNVLGQQGLVARLGVIILGKEKLRFRTLPYDQR